MLAIAAESGREGLLDRYRLKFLEHDAKLYLKDLVNLDDDEAERILATLDPELRRIPDHLLWRLDVHDRLLYGLALLGSVEGVREIKPAIKGHVSLEGRTVALTVARCGVRRPRFRKSPRPGRSSRVSSTSPETTSWLRRFPKSPTRIA